MSGVSGNKGLNFGGKFDIKDIIANQEKVIKGFNEIKKSSGGLTAKDFDTKPMTAYQAAMVKAKEETLALAKIKQDQATADKAASLVLQKALADERLAREAIITQSARSKADAQEAIRLAKEQATVQKQINDEARKASQQFTKGSADRQFQNPLPLGTAPSAAQSMLNLLNKEYKEGIISGKEYNKLLSELKEKLASNAKASTQAANASKEADNATKSSVLSKKDLAIRLEQERVKQQEVTASIKAYVKEQSSVKGSIEQRKAAIERLTLAYSKLTVTEQNSASGQRMAGIIGGLTDQVNRLKSATNGSNVAMAEQEGMFSQLKSQLGAVALGYASLAAVVGSVKAVIHTNAEISDSFTDVQRTAKLTASEVDTLVINLKRLNTRTSLEGLLDIGFEGGRLGVAKEDLLDFITTVDKLGVVLKKEIGGGAAQVAESLGKIAIVFKLAENEGITLAQAMNKVASSQLELAHSGPVTVKYLQDFTLGMAGTAAAAKLSLPVIEAYGAVLGGSGQIASSAALSITRLISGLSTKRDKYFAIAQLADATLTIEKFTNIINTDAKSALDLFFKGLKAGNPLPTELDDRLKSVGITTGKVSNTVKILAENQDVLAEKINLGTKAYEKAESVSHNFELSNNSLAASFDKVFNAIKNSIVVTSASRWIGDYINSVITASTESENLARTFKNSQDEFNNTQKQLTPLLSKYDELKAKTTLTKDEQEELRRVTAEIGAILPTVVKEYNSYSDAIDINRDKVERLTGAQRELLKLQNESSVAGLRRDFEDWSIYAKQLDEASKSMSKDEGGFFGSRFDEKGAASYSKAAKIISGKAYESAKAIRDLGGELSELEQKSIEYYEGEKKRKKQAIAITGDGSSEITPEGGEIIDIASIKKEIKSLTEANIKLKGVGQQFKINVDRIRELRKQLKEAGGGVDNSGAKQESAFESMAKRRNAIQKEITDQIELSKRKQLSADDEEVESVSKKYQDLKDKANQYYIDLAKQQKSGKLNPKQVSGLNIALAGLDQAEIAQKQVIIDKQANERFKQQLADQSNLFLQFESYKEKVGQDAAEKRFKGEFTTAADYAKKLEDLQTKLLSDIGDPLNATEAQKQQLDIVKAQIDSLNKYKQDKDDQYLVDAIQSSKTLNDKLLEIDKNYQNKKTALEKAGLDTPEAIAKLTREKALEVSKASVDELTGSETWTKLFSNLDNLATSDIDKLISEIESKFGDLSVKFAPADLTAVMESLNKAKAELIERNPFKEVGRSIQDVFTDSVKGIKKSDEQIQADWNNLGKATEGAFKFVDDAVKSTDFLKDAIGEVGATAIASLGTMASVAITVTAAIKATEKASVVLAIISAALAVAQAISGFLKSIFNAHDKRIEKSIKGHKENVDALEASYSSLERTINKAIGGEVEKLHKQQIENLKQQEAELLKIRDAEQSKKKPDQSKINDVNNQIAEISDKIDDVKIQMNEALTGTTSKAITDAIISGFKDGKRSAEDFADSFKDLMGDALYNAMKVSFLDVAIADFYKEFAEASKAGLTDAKIASLKSKYEGIIAEGAKQADEIDKIIGGSDKKNETGLVGKLQRELTETTASEFLGVSRASYEVNLKTYNQSLLSFTAMTTFAKDNLDSLARLESHALRTAINTDKLLSIESSLATIASNSKPQQTSADLGIGR